MADLALILSFPQPVLADIALRHRLAVYKHTVKRLSSNDSDRAFWRTVMRMLKEWLHALIPVQLDHMIPLSWTNLIKTLRELAAQNNESRMHQSLGGDSPVA